LLWEVIKMRFPIDEKTHKPYGFPVKKIEQPKVEEVKKEDSKKVDIKD